jgi:hypothetical protein
MSHCENPNHSVNALQSTAKMGLNAFPENSLHRPFTGYSYVTVQPGILLPTLCTVSICTSVCVLGLCKNACNLYGSLALSHTQAGYMLCVLICRVYILILEYIDFLHCGRDAPHTRTFILSVPQLRHIWTREIRRKVLPVTYQQIHAYGRKPSKKCVCLQLIFHVGDSGGPAVIKEKGCPTATLVGMPR